MFIDIVGIFLTIIMVNIRYWFMVLLICLCELMLSFLLSISLQSNINQVIAGGIFNHVIGSEGKHLLSTLLGPLFFLCLGLGLLDFKKLRWIDLVNPISDFKEPWPIIMMKTAVFRIVVIAMLYDKYSL